MKVSMGAWKKEKKKGRGSEGCFCYVVFVADNVGAEVGADDETAANSLVTEPDSTVDSSVKEDSVDEMDAPLQSGLVEDSFLQGNTWEAALKLSIKARMEKDPKDATDDERQTFLCFALVIMPKIYQG